MSDSLGKCSVCGDRAGVLYPLLSGSPAFCNEHHNPRDAEPFGCDFTGPDDFDIPDEDLFPIPRLQKLDRITFIWKDKGGTKHLLEGIDDGYLQNIINYLDRGEGHVPGGDDRRKRVINFLRKEQEIRKEMLNDQEGTT